MSQEDFLPSISAFRFCVAPMMGVTDRHFRFLARCLSQKARLYTEMVPAQALLHADPRRFLSFSLEERPLALQIGGSDAKALAHACRLAETYGFDEVNLNAGCPSKRVQAGEFGAVLMKTPKRLAFLARAMTEATTLPVTVKHRIGVDDIQGYGFLRDLVGEMAASGVKVFIVHARAALLSLCTEKNRKIPPLCPDFVFRLKKDFPSQVFVLNGGLQNLQEARSHLLQADGVMLGRAVRDDLKMLFGVDPLFYGARPPEDAFLRLARYIQEEARAGVCLVPLAKWLISLAKGMPGAKKLRAQLQTSARLGPLAMISALEMLFFLKPFSSPEPLARQEALS